MPKKAYSFRLLKSHIENPSEALKQSHKLQEKPLSGMPENKRLFAGQAYSSPPSWISFFAEADRVNFQGLFGGQAAAILFVKVELPAVDGEAPEVRWVAVCFGMGFQELSPESLESQFGLKVAMNRLGQEDIRSLDTRRPEDATIQTRSQSNRTGDIFDFGLDMNRTILQAITGKAEENDFGGTLTGSDGLKLNCETNYDSIDDKALQIVQSFGDTAYENVFPWYGKITPITDRARINLLDNELLDRLTLGNIESIHLAPPEIIDYQQIDRFKFSGAGRGNGHDELDLGDYLALFDGQRPLTLEHLKNDKVRVASEDGHFIDRWTVFKCITCEVHLDGLLYILAADKWYAVRNDFVAEINAAIDGIQIVDLGLPPYLKGEKEGDYNERAANASENLFLYDKNLIVFEGERGRVEFCDLLTVGRDMIHVKRKNKSQTLSHLFMQGQVSAEAFLDYPALRLQIRNALPQVAAIIPEQRPNPTEYRVIYALLHEGNAALPFFSKVALANVCRQLERMNFRVAISWVGLAPAL